MREIALTRSQNSSFDVDIDGKRYNMTFRYNVRIPNWCIDLTLGGTRLLSGVPAVIGVELFQGNAVPNVPRNLIMVPIDESDEDANFDDLGERVKLVLVEEGDDIDVTTIQ